MPRSPSQEVPDLSAHPVSCPYPLLTRLQKLSWDLSWARGLGAVTSPSPLTTSLCSQNADGKLTLQELAPAAPGSGRDPLAGARRRRAGVGKAFGLLLGSRGRRLPVPAAGSLFS